MKVTVVQRDDQYASIFDHEATEAIVDEVRRHPEFSLFVATVVRNYESEHDLTNRDPSIERLANRWGRGRTAGEARTQICRAIRRLYSDFTPRHVRGVLVEALIQSGLRPRYAGSSDVLDNNIQFQVEDGGESHTTSTSIDVIGVDDGASIGECHDCKVRSRKFDANWVTELIEKVRPFGFRIGLATADSEASARHALDQMGIPLSRIALISSEHWGTRPPLQPSSSVDAIRRR